MELLFRSECIKNKIYFMEYNPNKLNNPDNNSFDWNNMPDDQHRKPHYGLAILAGLGTSVLVAIVLAVIGIACEGEYMLLLIAGAIIVGLVVRVFVPAHTIGGAAIGAILCPLTYFLYQIIIAIFGYYYEDDSNFWFILIGSVIYGAYVCYKKEED